MRKKNDIKGGGRARERERERERESEKLYLPRRVCSSPTFRPPGADRSVVRTAASSFSYSVKRVSLYLLR
jgi:hypothetical protein